MELSMAERVTTSLTILLTGFIVVFLVLILLIGLIKLYGTIVTKLLEVSEAKKAEKEQALSNSTKETEDTTKLTPVASSQVSATQDNNGIPEEIIAVIAAAVDAMYGQGAVKVKSIKKVPQSRPVWGTAGIMDNTRPF